MRIRGAGWKGAAVAVMLLALGIRLYCLCAALWLDEAYSWWDARQSLTDLWHLVPICDPHPPLYALLLKGWMALFGDSVAALRSLSALFGWLATLFVLLAGWRFSPRIGVIAGLLFALAPFQIEFALEARPYTLVSFASALLLYGLIRLLKDPLVSRTDWAGWAALVGGGLLSMWANNTAVFTLLAAGAAAMAILARNPSARPLFKPLCLAAIVVVVLWLPFLGVYLDQARGVSQDFWIPRPSAWRFVNELRFVVGLGSFPAFWGLFVLWLCGLWLLWRKGERNAALLLACMFALPTLFNYLVSITVKPIYLARALIGISPPFMIGLAVVLAGFRRLRFTVAVTALLLVSWIWVASSLHKQHRKEPWDLIAAAVVQEAGADTLILVVPNELALPLAHALKVKGSAANFEVRGVPENFPAPGRSARYPSGKCAPSILDQDLTAIAQAARGKGEVLFLTRRGNVYDPREEVRALLLDIGWRETYNREFLPGFLQLRRYAPPGD